jgi:hypothetical protein
MQENGLGYILADFLQTRLATLFIAYNRGSVYTAYKFGAPMFVIFRKHKPIKKICVANAGLPDGLFSNLKSQFA